MTICKLPLRNLSLVLCISIATFYSCSSDSDTALEPDLDEIAQEQETEDENEDETEDEEIPTNSSDCTNPLDFIFNEDNGLLVAEFESSEFSEDWKLKSDGDNHTGEGYMVWEGDQHLGNPGNGLATFKIKITTAGTYRFMWHSAVKIGDNGTDHNDSWLRFSDADDFYGQNGAGTSTVYPKDIGKTPNPEGATKDGWFKIYRSGNDLDFKWQSTTFDNNGHNIFIVFENPGTYLMEISARSTGHGIDKFVLFNDTLSVADATGTTEMSVISCD